jgi:hypothetical protein
MFTYLAVKNKLDTLQDPYTTLENDENFIGRKNKSFWMVAILWIITIPICWFLIPSYFEYHHLMIILGSVLQLILTFFCEKEHIAVMHDAVANDSYYWTKTAFLLSVECCMVLGIFMGILGSIQIVYLITMLLIIWLPRLMFKPW